MRIFRALCLALLCLLAVGCGARESTPECTGPEARARLSTYLAEHGHISPDFRTEDGDYALVWASESAGDPMEEITVNGEDAWLCCLRYGDPSPDLAEPVMTGRRYMDYAVTRDGSSFYFLNVAAETWEPLSTP